MFCDTGHFSVFLDDAFDRAGSEATEIARSVDFVEVTAIIKEKWNQGIGASIEIILDAFSSGG